jgi:hypothetical protein
MSTKPESIISIDLISVYTNLIPTAITTTNIAKSNSSSNSITTATAAGGVVAITTHPFSPKIGNSCVMKYNIN